MKQTTIAVLLTIALIACQKSAPITESKKDPYFIRVAAPNGLTVDYSPVAIVKGVNGGQYSENEFGSLEYAGYNNNYYVLTVVNKQGCGIDFKAEWLDKDSNIYTPPASTKVIYLPGPAIGNEKIKVKPTYRCGFSGGDLGWLEIFTPISLPVTFKYIRAENVGNNQVKVSFEVSEASGVDAYWIQLSKDGINYTNAVKVESSKVVADKVYSLTIQL